MPKLKRYNASSSLRELLAKKLTLWQQNKQNGKSKSFKLSAVSAAKSQQLINNLAS
jgi:hypothetical protein